MIEETKIAGIAARIFGAAGAVVLIDIGILVCTQNMLLSGTPTLWNALLIGVLLVFIGAVQLAIATMEHKSTEK